MALPYYRLMAYSLPAIMLYGCFKQFMEGIGNTVTPMAIALTTNLINILFNWLFIFGNGGFEPMGVYGAGMATLIARWISPVLIIAYFIFIPKYRDYLQLFSRGVNYIKNGARLLAIGTPVAGQMLLEGSAFVVTSIMMGWFGEIALAANQIVMTYGNAAFMMTVALGSAATIRVSHSYGIRDKESLRHAVTAATHLAIAWGTFVLVAFIVLRFTLPRLFTPNEEIIALAAQMFIPVAIYQLSDSIQGSMVGVMRGIQDVKSIALISLFAYVLLNIPVGYFFAFTLNLGSTGLLIGYIVGLSTAAIAYSVRVARQIQK
jgi:MATE family multidrug resistance protein